MHANALSSPPRSDARPWLRPSILLGSLWLSLLLPSVSAADLAYTVEGIEVEGASAIQGLLGVLRLDVGVASAPTLEISAPSGFRVDRDFLNQTVTALSVNGSLDDAFNDSGRYTVASAASGTVRSAGHRPGHEVFIAPWEGHEPPRIEVQSKDSWELRPSQTETVQQTDYVGNGSRGLVSAEVGGSQRLTDPTGGRDITITGSFVALFWEWDLELDSPDVDPGSRQVQSGTTYDPDPPDTGAPPPVDDWVGDAMHLASSSKWWQTYLYVTNGTLRLTVEDARWHDFYLYAQEAGVEGRLALKGALPIDGGLGALPADKGFQGSLRAALGPSGADRIAVRFVPATRLDESAPQGEPPIESIQLGSPPAASPADGAVAADPETSPLGIGLSVLAVALILLVAARAVMNHRRFNGLEGLMEAQDYHAVLARSSPLLPTRRYGSKVAVMHAVALLKTGQPSRASAFLAGLPARRWPPAPTMDYLQACAEVLQGRRDEAARLLKECLEQDPSFAADASLNAWFLPLASHPLLAAWFGGADFGGSYT